MYVLAVVGSHLYVWSLRGAKLALHVAHYNQALFGRAPARTGSDRIVLQGICI